VRIASIQLEITDGKTKAQMVNHALSMMDRCAGFDLLLLPEIWNIGFLAYDNYHKESESIDGYTASAIASKAKELGTYVFSGSFVESRGEKYYNTSVLFDRTGEKIGQYSKMHLFTYKSREPELLTRGREIVVVDTEFGKMGLSTCYDLRFPEMYRQMVDKGAEFFLVASGWPFPRLEAWNIFNQARATENMCFLASCNMAGTQNNGRYLGHSQIIDPWGTVVAASDFKERIVCAEIDPRAVREARAEFPVLNDRVL
jgi:predicted amidohydrolase